MGILNRIKKWIIASFISNIIRRILSVSGGSLVTYEILTKTEAETWKTLCYKALAGALLIVIDLAWSYVEKKYLKAALPMK